MLWDGQHGPRGDTCTKATSASGTRVCKGKCARVDFRAGHLGFKYPQKSWKNRKQSKRLNAMHSGKKGREMNREGKGQEHNKDTNGNGKMGENEMKMRKSTAERQRVPQEKRILT